MNKKILFSLVVVFLCIVAVAGWYLISPLFIDTVVSEERIVIDAQTLSTGSFVDADSFHQVSGDVFILESNQSRSIRIENFESTNGPDLKVYLATDETASDFVSLGDLKGNIGNQNYDVGDDVDFAKYDTVLIWCEQFGVLFGSANLS